MCALQLNFEKLCSVEHLFACFCAFRKGKRQKEDVAAFSLHLLQNLSRLSDELLTGTYKHGEYEHFRVNDPKQRDIHKASVRDRVVHHMLYSALYPYFDRLFIHDSYSCRKEKGTHRALARLETFARKESRNHTRTVWVLHCDIQKCFSSINHARLKHIVRRHIACERTLRVLESIIDSFHSRRSGRGIPLGNVTSQLFVNIYLNKLDQYVKRTLKVPRYIRYADDMALFSHNRELLVRWRKHITRMLTEQLRLNMHPHKRTICTVAAGVDFLGWVHFPHHRVLRTKTKQRMLRRITKNPTPRVRDSYHALLAHGNAHNLQKMLQKTYNNHTYGTAAY